MSQSFFAYKVIREKDVIQSFWCNDGTILIIQHLPRHQIWGLKTTNAIHLSPLEILNILKKKELLFEGQRPGFLNGISKIEVNTKNNIVTIKETRKRDDNSEYYYHLCFSKLILENIFINTKKVWLSKRTVMRPLVGLNCKSGSFDSLEGSLDQDKKNEEQRIIVRKALNGN